LVRGRAVRADLTVFNQEAATTKTVVDVDRAHQAYQMEDKIKIKMLWTNLT
jgi:hypothetical protein